MARKKVLRRVLRKNHSDIVPSETSQKSCQSQARFTSSVEGMSIDVAAILGKQSENGSTIVEEDNENISPLFAASPDHSGPPMCPRAPDSANSANMAPSPHCAEATNATTSVRINLGHAQAFVSSRRSKIMSKVSSRITRLRQTKDRENNVENGKQSNKHRGSLQEQKNRRSTHVEYMENSPQTLESITQCRTRSISECQTRSHASSGVEAEDFSNAQNAREMDFYIDEYPHDIFLSLLDSLGTNKSIQKLGIIRNHQDDGVRTIHSGDLDHLFHILHALSNTLSELTLSNFRLQDLTSLSLGLYDHASIEHLQLNMESGMIDEVTSKAIASMPNLVSVEFEMRGSFPLWPLFTSKSLTVLSVVGNHFIFDGPDILAMADSLETNSVLQVLNLEPLIPTWCFVALITSLRTCEESNLETLQFSCQTENNKDGDACTMEIIKLLKRPQSKLRVIWNHCFESVSVNNYVKDLAMSALYVCTTIQQFHVFMESIEYGEIKTHVLERNMRSEDDSAREGPSEL